MYTSLLRIHPKCNAYLTMTHQLFPLGLPWSPLGSGLLSDYLGPHGIPWATLGVLGPGVLVLPWASLGYLGLPEYLYWVSHQHALSLYLNTYTGFNHCYLLRYGSWRTAAGPVFCFRTFQGLSRPFQDFCYKMEFLLDFCHKMGISSWQFCNTSLL
jgi:hypothetical protein